MEHQIGLPGISEERLQEVEIELGFSLPTVPGMSSVISCRTQKPSSCGITKNRSCSRSPRTLEPS